MTDNSPIRRFKNRVTPDGDHLTESPDGDWVDYEDHVRAAAALARENAELRKKVMVAEAHLQLQGVGVDTLLLNNQQIRDFAKRALDAESANRALQAENERVRKMLNTYGVSDERMRGNISTGLDVLVTRMTRQVDGSESANRALQAEVDRLRIEEDLSEQARKMMADILTRTVNILRGEPEPLKQHSWHDIPDRVQALIAAANSSNRGHVYYGAGEKDCPREIKSGNGELHTMMCKRCGEKNPRGICKAAIAYTGTELQEEKIK